MIDRKPVPRAIVILLLLALVGLAPLASAHAQYLASQPPSSAILPQGPASVTVTLSEDVDPSTAAIRVTDSAGARFDNGTPHVSPVDARTFAVDLKPPGPGIYTVTWSATSAVDGHFTAGSYAFAVQNPDGSLPGSLPGAQTTVNPAVSPIEVAIRAGAFFAMTASAGALGLAFIVWSPAAGRLKGPTAPAASQGLRTLLLWGGGNALALASLASAWAAFAMMTAVQAGATSDFTSSTFLQSLEARVILAGAAGGLALWLWWRSRDSAWKLHPALLAGAFGLALAAVWTTSLASHSAAALQWQPLGGLADATHLFGVSLWVGGVLALLTVRPHLQGPAGADLASRVFERFARMAFFAVGLVLLAGLFLSLIQIGSLDRVTATPYGYVVIAKASLFAPMVALGAHNHYKSIPLLKDGARGPQALARIVKNVRVEAVLAVVVLTLAGLLTTLSPGVAVVPQTQAFILEQTKDGVEVEFQVYPPPGPPGVYTVSVLLWDPVTGDGYNNATQASLRFTLVNTTTPPSTVPLEGPHANHFFNETPAMSQPGTWRVDVGIQRSDGFDIRVTFYINIREAQTT